MIERIIEECKYRSFNLFVRFVDDRIKAMTNIELDFLFDTFDHSNSHKTVVNLKPDIDRNSRDYKEDVIYFEMINRRLGK